MYIDVLHNFIVPGFSLFRIFLVLKNQRLRRRAPSQVLWSAVPVASRLRSLCRRRRFFFFRWMLLGKYHTKTYGMPWNAMVFKMLLYIYILYVCIYISLYKYITVYMGYTVLRMYIYYIYVCIYVYCIYAKNEFVEIRWLCVSKLDVGPN